MKNIGINNQYIRESLKHSDFDEKSLNALIDDTNPQVALEVTLSFQQNIQNSQKIIDKALLEQDIDSIWKAIHKISGTAELVGYTRFGRYSRQLSHKIKDIPQLESHADDIRDYLNRVKSVENNIHVGLLALYKK